MGIAELDTIHDRLIIYSHIITYGNAADPVLTELMRDEIETMWNEPEGMVFIDDKGILVSFVITAAHQPGIAPEEVLGNDDPRNNYFRIEEFCSGNISFVDGVGCNSGYFKLDNLYKGSTTAAHEYGHTLGLDHPHDLDLRGKGVPGIMFPRGTLTDPQFQYNINAASGDGKNGGTMHPMYRKVRGIDIAQLRLDKLDFENNRSIVGEFSSIWHLDHKNINDSETA